MILRSSRNKICSLKIFRQATGSKCHKKLNWKMKILPRLLPLIFQAAAFDYSLTGAGNIVLTDEATSITDIVTIFTDESVLVTVDGIEWNATGSVEGSDNLLRFETLVDGETQASGSISLEDVSRELPTSIDAGAIKVDKGGRYTIEVILSVDSSEESTSESYEAYAAGVAIIPLIMVLVFAITTQMVSQNPGSPTKSNYV